MYQGDIMNEQWDREKLTPMMKQYMEVKDRYQDAILFYRLGDFYEMFFEDALTACTVLEIALTGRNAGLEERIPMCGVPFHAADAYIQKLIDNGFKVAICEQLEAPSQNTKIVKRDVVKVITPGTTIDVASNDYNFILGLDSDASYYYLALCDCTTGKLKAHTIVKDINELYKQIQSYNIKEIVLDTSFDSSSLNAIVKSEGVLLSFVKEDDSFKHDVLNNIQDQYLKAFKQVLSYIQQMNMSSINYYLDIEYTTSETMDLDFSTKFALELTSTIKNKEKYGSLFWYLDKTKTAMGGRLLKEFIQQPLKNEVLINQRLDFVQALLSNFITTETLSIYLKDIYDLLRITSKLSIQSISPKEMLWLLKSLKQAKLIQDELSLIEEDVVKEYLSDYDALVFLQEAIVQTIDANLIEGNQDKIIKDGVDELLDHYRQVVQESSQWLLDFESRQKELTGIKNLKVKYNKVFGYYIEVSNANKDLIKDEYGYIRKQTLANAERYINSELKEQESLILTANENLAKLENDLYKEFVAKLTPYTKPLQLLGQKLAYLDVMVSFYTTSNQFNFTRPIFNKESIIDIKDSFHPVLKAIDSDHDFINNDFYMDKDTSILIITGPNMGGKSTYERQLALIVIMAQMGCYVPAASCHIKLFDQIYTRIGANDNQLEGQSTFMVEMLEASHAINKASDDSLILFDELGRGTATFDGLSIAYAMLEYLAKHSKAKVLFSTHYHELTRLASLYPNIKNYQACVDESNQQITFTYKIKEGSINKSYGIHVAKLAAMPQGIIENAYRILHVLEEENDLVNVDLNKQVKVVENKDGLKEEILGLNINELSPLQALTYLSELQTKLKE